MAKTNDIDDYAGDDEAGPPQANSAARAETIRNACRQITELEGERREASEAIRNIKATLIKGDLAMKVSDFNVALRLYKLEGEDRDQLFDTLKETFEALGQGQQLGFLDALRTPQPHADA